MPHTPLTAIRWSILGEAATRLSQPLLLLVLGRILMPKDFGLVAVASIVIGVAQVIQDFGLGKTLVQVQEDFEKACTCVFWINMVVATSIYAFVYLAAPTIAEHLRSPEAGPLIRILTLRVLVNASVTVHQAVLQRALDFKTLFYGRVAASLLPVVVSVPLALAGYGPWALVVGALSGSAGQMICLWRRSPWEPSIAFHPQTARALLSFSGWVCFEGLMAVAINWGDSAIVAANFSTTDLGMYQLAMSITRSAYGIILTSFVPVTFSVLAGLRSDRASFLRYFATSSKTIIILGGFAAGLLHVSATPGLVLLLGEQWRGADAIVGILSIRVAFDSIVALNPSVITALGRPDINSKYLLLVALVSLPALLLAAGHGMIALCYTRLALMVFDDFVSGAIATKLMKAKALLFPSLAARALLAFLVSIATAFAVRRFAGNSPGLSMIVATVTFAVSYIGLVAALDFQALRRVQAIVAFR